MKKTKALISTALAFCIGAAAAVPAFAVEEKFTFTKIGDYDANNRVDVSDITALQLQLSGDDVITGTALEQTDFNGDGSFDVNDVSEMQKMVAGEAFKCYRNMDSSYRDIEQKSYPYDGFYGYGSIGGTYIKSEKIFGADDYFMTVDEKERSPFKGSALITSKEQFCDLFKAESPEFDDEFFKENALFITLTVMHRYDSSGIYQFETDGNKLIVYDYRVDTYWESGQIGDENKIVCENNIYKLNKSDIENITEIGYCTTYLAQ